MRARLLQQPLISGSAESLAVIGLFLAFGLGWGALEPLTPLEQRAGAFGANYPAPTVASDPQPSPSLWLVDGFNVLHTGLLHGRDRAEWWTAPQREALLSRVRQFDDPEVEIWVVFDGPHDADAEAGATAPRVHPVFAPSADAWLLARLRDQPDPASVTVVTADRAVADRARHRGARVVSPQEFLGRCRS
jgi:predicted RNA-binding protein with PIN domain